MRKPECGRAHLHLQVPAIAHLAHAEPVQSRDAQRPQRTHIGVAHAASEADRSPDQVPSRNLVPPHAAGLTVAARGDDQIFRAVEDRGDDGGQSRGVVRTVAVQEHHHFRAHSARMRGPAGAGLAVATTMLDHNLGARLPRLGDRRVGAAAIDHDYHAERLTRQTPHRKTDRARLVQDRDDRGDRGTQRLQRRPQLAQASGGVSPSRAARKSW